MKKLSLLKTMLAVAGLLTCAGSALAQSREPLNVNALVAPGMTAPVWVSLSGFTGEAAQTLQFDLYVQGFGFTNAAAAQYVISGSNNGNLQATATDRMNNHVVVKNTTYTGASLRRQAHTFVDNFVRELKGKPICQTRIAFRGDTSTGKGEIFVASFDGSDPMAETKDNALVTAPCWVPGRIALYYTSYKLNHPDIYFHDLMTGSRRTFARYGGSNMSPAPSPDGSKVAMILSKDGWTDLYVGGAEGGSPLRLTRSRQDESAPCWSPDGKWICYGAKDGERRTLSKISPAGGQPQVIKTGGIPSPTEPDWSPDGKWIAFTMMTRDGFQICVVPAEGGTATVLAEGEDPSWSPNSRTLVYSRRQGGRSVLAMLDVPTKQSRDLPRISGSNSQSQPSWAR
jgi:TolB protein